MTFAILKCPQALIQTKRAVMQAIRKIIDASLLAPIISLPKELQDGEVEIIVLPFTPKSENVSHSITEDRKSSISLNKKEGKVKSSGSLPFSVGSFGMWRDRTDMPDVNQYVRGIRDGRRFDY
jgi:hypothetical protein